MGKSKKVEELSVAELRVMVETADSLHQTMETNADQEDWALYERKQFIRMMREGEAIVKPDRARFMVVRFVYRIRLKRLRDKIARETYAEKIRRAAQPTTQEVRYE